MIDRPNILLALLIPGFRMGRTGFVVGLTLATLLVLISLIGEEFYWNVDWLFAGALLGVWVAFMAIVNRFIDLGTPWLWLLLAPIPVINLLLVGRFLFGPGTVSDDDDDDDKTPPLSPWAQATAMAELTSLGDDNVGNSEEPQAEPAWRPIRTADPVLSQNVEAVERTRPMDTDDAVQRL